MSALSRTFYVAVLILGVLLDAMIQPRFKGSSQQYRVEGFS